MQHFVVKQSTFEQSAYADLLNLYCDHPESTVDANGDLHIPFTPENKATIEERLNQRIKQVEDDNK